MSTEDDEEAPAASAKTAPWPTGRRRSWLGAIGVVTRRQCGQDLHLVVRRGEVVRAPGRWCFPGGEIEPGETSREAVVRELREELGVDVVPHSPLGLVAIPEARWRLVAWAATMDGSTVRPDRHEVAEAAWLTPREILALPDGLPSNARVLELIERVRSN